MSTFDKRQDGFEAKYAHDETLKFKAHARRNRALGLWAAGKLGLTGEEADAYARTLIEADLEEAGDDDVFRKLKADFEAKSLDVSEHRIRRTMDELLEQAMAQLKSGT
ncbi:DUF1476 domain-containing protein [Ancylobacter amanitiformis]|uniref:DUF1476 domain-containing protein n=1 Tax=Ancylobacter amanitiformis TaxID=217069 RepID=A0ABU0LKV5_9HYPH|nr:DUF1476 domain-containing protein [Ancylobacter amanitiformis]MDQ0509326.1 hypothetical protein [Ancylobacter amanitiformis]